MNDAIEKMLDEQPFIIFSPYTTVQIQIVHSFGDEILDTLDNSIKEDKNGNKSVHNFSLIYGHFWLWVLGTFEILRTAVSAKPCFSTSAYSALSEFKNKLVKLRVPFTKQQYAGRKEVISGEASITSIDTSKKDFQFQVEDEAYWIREIILEFNELVNNIKRNDVLMSYKEHMNTKNG